MLQIVTKQYFRPDVPLHETLHRRVLHTNRLFLRTDAIELPLGRLLPSNGTGAVSHVTVEITEFLEAEELDGSRSTLVATGGAELVSDLADVLSFGLNATFSADADLVERLVPAVRQPPPRNSAAGHFRGTFDAGDLVTEEELDALRAFMTTLLALRRPEFEASMRAIRRIVAATRRAVADPTSAYVDLVAALESLSGSRAKPMPWEALDSNKRATIDNAIETLEPGQREAVRRAVLETERVGLKRRFVEFAVSGVSADYFRDEADGALRPPRGADFERALKLAYDIRSRSVHALRELPAEAWAIGDRAETIDSPDDGIMLTLEGLRRLCGHLVRGYVRQSPAVIDQGFEWRANLPGVIRMRAASKYWIWQADGFEHRSVLRYFNGLLEHVVDVFAGREEALTDMREVLTKVEQRVAGTQPGLERTAMVGMYVLWHHRLADDDRLPGSGAFVSQYGDCLQEPGMIGFAVAVALGPLPDWTTDQWQALAVERRRDREKRQHLELPASVDAALQVVAASCLADDGRIDEAGVHAAYAVEELPGSRALVDWEAALVAGRSEEIDIGSLVYMLPAAPS
ncbi:MAG: hypothetical protein JHC84_10805 [Solirubrobacteraceae bacterium]|nr:hypothetical protein [Solirubrobacteraceae bacterium]